MLLLKKPLLIMSLFCLSRLKIAPPKWLMSTFLLSYFPTISIFSRHIAYEIAVDNLPLTANNPPLSGNNGKVLFRPTALCVDRFLHEIGLSPYPVLSRPVGAYELSPISSHLGVWAKNRELYQNNKRGLSPPSVYCVTPSG